MKKNTKKKTNNKKNNIVRDVVILVVVLLIFGVVFLVDYNSKKGSSSNELKLNSDFIYLKNFKNEANLDTNYVFTNYEDYKEKIGSDVLSAKDFEKNNYVLVVLDYNPCAEDNVTPTDYKVSSNKIDITVKYEGKCGLCAPEYLYYLLKVDKDVTEAELDFNYVIVNNTNCDPNVSYKPLIYLYPKEEMNVSVRLGKPEALTTTYPKYNNSWNVLALPDGSLYDKDGRYYYGLYWEGLNNIEEEFNDGFVVSRDDTIKFLEEKLSILGLNEREANEFIMYWLPKLEENEYNLIRFASKDVIDSEMPLDITPTPDTVIRVLMEYKPLDKKINIKKQNLTKVERNGFTVVEWGGTLIK